MKRQNFDALLSPVSVIGAACRLPGAICDPASFWQFLDRGARLRAQRPSPARFGNPDLKVPKAAAEAMYLDRVDLFDAAFFGISPREAMRMDPQHRLFMELVIEALHDAAIPPEALSGRSVGIYLGLYGADYAWLPEAMACPPDVHSASGGGPAFAANRVSHALNLRGPSLVVDTTCSSSLVATHLAVSALHAQECEIAIVGGVNLILSADVAASGASAVPFPPQGQCDSFAKSACGAVMAEGGTVLVLQPAQDARRQARREIAHILGTAVNHDGQASSLTAPNPDAQAEVIQKAFEVAGVPVDRLAYLEAHGTGTELGDAIEIEGAAQALASLGKRSGAVGIGAIKAQLGHLEAAAGATGLLRACLSLQHRRVTAHPMAGPPHSAFATTPLLFPATEGLALETGALVGVSAFSLGGTNAHVVLGGPAPPDQRQEVSTTDPQSWTLPISARSKEALSAQVTRLEKALNAPPLRDAKLGDIAGTAARGRAGMPFRSAITANSLAQLRVGLEHVQNRLAATDLIRRVAPEHREVVFVLPGHGSQWSGMAKGLLGKDPVFDRAVTRLDAQFRAHIDLSVAQLLNASDDPGALRHALHAQPALFCVQMALAEMFMARGVRPAAFLGYSAGELPAMVLSAMLTEQEAVRLCATRAQYLADAPEGAMLSVRLGESAVRRMLSLRAPKLEIAAVNGPETVVLSGPVRDMAAFAQDLEDQQILCIDAQVPYAFHHSAMADTSADLETLFAQGSLDWQEAQQPVYSCVLGGRLSRDRLTPSYWRAAACDTLRFDRAAQAALEDGFRTFLEISPSAALVGDLRDLFRANGSSATAIASLRRGVDDQRALAITGAELYETGAIDTPAAFNPGPGNHVALPTYAWQRQSFWWPAAPKVTPEAAKTGDEDKATPSRVCYALQWQQCAPEPYRLTLPGPEALARIDAAAQIDTETEALALYARHEPEVTQICAAFAAQALRKLSAGRPVPDVGVLANRLNLAAPKQRLLERIYRIAAAAGGRQETAEARHRTRADDDPVAALSRLIEALPMARAELEMLARTGPHLADIVLDERDALDLLFPGGNASQAAALFSDSGISKVMNAMAARAVGALIADPPSGKGPRVLEIGAGTGGTTAALLPVLARSGGAYTVTDISPTLLRHAEARFSQRVAQMRFARFDITKPAEPQGIVPGSFDLVVCANVLHATPDIQASLKAVHDLLAPGGVLLLLEAVQPQALVDLTFGLTRDWWAFEDSSLRADHPLLPLPSWRNAISQTGFGSVTSLPESDALARQLESAVILARKPSVDKTAQDRTWLVIGGRPALRGAVTKALAPMSRDIIEVAAPPDELPAAFGAAGSCGIVDLRGLSHRAPESGTASAAMSGLREVVPGVLALVRLLARRRGQAPMLIFPTFGATRPLACSAAVDPVQTALAALSDALAAEHPDWDLRRPDICPATPQACAHAIVAEARARRRDLCRTHLGAERYTPQLRPVRDTPDLRPQLSPEQLFAITGGLGALGLEIADWLVERGARQLLLAQRGQGSEDAATRIAALRARGVAVTLHCVDLSDPEAASDFGQRLAERPLGGIVHAAGVFRDRLLMQQDWEGFEAVLSAKLFGGWETLAAISAHPKAFLIYCGSAAGLLNPAGIANYVSANAFLGGLASRARSCGLNATAIAWGGWSGLGMATHQSRRWFDRWKRMGISSLSRADLFAALDLAQSGQAPPELWVMDVDWARYGQGQPEWRRAILPEALCPHQAPPGAPLAPQSPSSTALDRNPPARPRGAQDVVDTLRQCCLQILELGEHYDLEPDMPLADLGLDSLLAIELRSMISEVFVLDLAPTLLFDCPTLEDLVLQIKHEISRDAALATRQ